MGPPGTDAAPWAAPPGTPEEGLGGRPWVPPVPMPDQADTRPGARSGQVGTSAPSRRLCWALIRFPASPVEMSLLPTPWEQVGHFRASRQREGALTVSIRSVQTAEQFPHPAWPSWGSLGGPGIAPEQGQRAGLTFGLRQWFPGLPLWTRRTRWASPLFALAELAAP